MVKQKMDSLSSSTAKRHSIGLANLADLLPMSPIHAGKVTYKKHRHSMRKKPSFSALSSLGEAGKLEYSESEASTERATSTSKINEREAPAGQLRSAEPTCTDTQVDPQPPADVTPTDLYEAIGRDEFFEFLELQRIELCGGDEDDITVKEGRVFMNVNTYRDADHGKTLLHQACRRANLQVIKCLLYHGACAMEQCSMGRSPFHDIISAGKRELALVVLQALYEYEPRGLSLVDHNGTHVVHLAAIHGCLDVLQWCATVAKTDTALSMTITSFSGRNVLHYAAYNGRLQVLEWLLQCEDSGSPSIASLDVNGYSVLHYASMGGHLSVCQWLVLDTPSRQNLSIVATNTDGNSALDLAKAPELIAFLEQVSVVPSAPSRVACIGGDSTTLGITWTLEQIGDDDRLHDVFAARWFELEYCKKPTGLRRASAMLGLIMGSASAATASASSYLLNWEKLNVLIEAEATEYWLTGLDSDCEYIVRMRILNRNGYSEYSVPDLATEFRTAPASTARTLDAPFIGTLTVELLEARRLLTRDCGGSGSTPPHSRRHDTTDRGRYFAIVSLELPGGTDDALPPRRQTSLSPHQSQSSDSTMTKRELYRLHTEFAAVQQELVLSGSLHAYRHPKFNLHTKLRVPESIEADIVVSVIHEASSMAHSATVGTVRMPLTEFVRGFPAKQQWFSLASGHSECDHSHGELLVRTLFLADGNTTLPHPTKSGVYCSSAEDLLDREDDGEDASAHAQSASSTASSILTASSSTSPSSSSSSSPLEQSHADKFDALGFKVWSSRAVTFHRPFEYHRLHQLCVAQQQEKLWMRYHHQAAIRPTGSSASPSTLRELLSTDSNGTTQYENPSSFRSSPDLRRLVWDGIPPSSRRLLYMKMSGADAKRSSTGKDHYRTLLKTAESMAIATDGGNLKRPDGFDVARRQIQVDLQRTFAGNESWINTEDGQAAMGRVLLAYAVHNEQIGYCQSMSFIVGRLLCLFHSGELDEEGGSHQIEEDVFWLLAALCEDYFPKYYTKGMEGLHVDGLVLEMLLQKRLPKVARHFEVVLQNPAQMGLLLVTGWLMPVFCAVFPSETSFRLLDVLFFEGSGAVFAIVIALLRTAQPQLLQYTKDHMQLFRLLKQRDQRLHDTALLLEVAHDEQLLLESEYATLRKRCELQFRARQATQEQHTGWRWQSKRGQSTAPSSTSVFF